MQQQQQQQFTQHMLTSHTFTYTNYFIDVTFSPLYVCHLYFVLTPSLSLSLCFVLPIRYGGSKDGSKYYKHKYPHTFACNVYDKIEWLFSFSYIFSLFLRFFESANIKMTLFGVRRRCIVVPFLCVVAIVMKFSCSWCVSNAHATIFMTNSKLIVCSVCSLCTHIKYMWKSLIE